MARFCKNTSGRENKPQCDPCLATADFSISYCYPLLLQQWPNHQRWDVVFYNPRDWGALKMNGSSEIDCRGRRGGSEHVCEGEDGEGLLTANRVGSHLWCWRWWKGGRLLIIDNETKLLRVWNLACARCWRAFVRSRQVAKDNMGMPVIVQHRRHARYSRLTAGGEAPSVAVCCVFAMATHCSALVICCSW